MGERAERRLDAAQEMPDVHPGRSPQRALDRARQHADELRVEELELASKASRRLARGRDADEVDRSADEKHDARGRGSHGDGSQDVRVLGFAAFVRGGGAAAARGVRRRGDERGERGGEPRELGLVAVPRVDRLPGVAQDEEVLPSRAPRRVDVALVRAAAPAVPSPRRFGRRFGRRRRRRVRGAPR
jgi:hypothetical protein